MFNAKLYYSVYSSFNNLTHQVNNTSKKYTFFLFENLSD